MLVHGAQVHTESGAHSKILKTWGVWARDVGFRVKPGSPAAARKFLEERVAQIGGERSSGTLPWTGKM